MASKYMKKYSTSLVIKEMQIKTTLRFHLTLVRMAIIKGNNDKCWQGYPDTLLMGMEIRTTILESSREIPQKAKDRPAI
jgi:hypothetical protein